jgi:transposase
VINFVRRCRETGSIVPGKLVGHRPKAVVAEHRARLPLRIMEKTLPARA